MESTGTRVRISNRKRRCDRCRNLTTFAWAIYAGTFRIWICDECLTVNEREATRD